MRTFEWRGRLLAAATATAMALGFGSQGFAQAPEKKLTVNYGGPSAGYYTVYVAQELGLYEKYGLEPKFHWFTSGAPLLAALKSKSIDVITTGLATVFAIDQKIPIKILLWELDNGAGEALIVAKDSPITSYKDLPKAKAIGGSAGTCAQVNIALIARSQGVKFSSLNVINIAPPLYGNAFASGSIDAAIGWAPHSLVLAQSGYKVVAWDADYGGICPSVTSVRTDFLKDNPEIGNKLVRIHDEARAAIEKNPRLAIDALIKQLSISETVAKAFYEAHCCKKMPTLAEQVSPESAYSMTAKQKGLALQLFTAGEMLAETGTIKAALPWGPIEEAIDPSYIQAYLKELKK